MCYVRPLRNLGEVEVDKEEFGVRVGVVVERSDVEGSKNLIATDVGNVDLTAACLLAADLSSGAQVKTGSEYVVLEHEHDMTLEP